MFGLGHGHSLSLAASRPLSVPFVGVLDEFTAGLVVCWSVTRRLLASYIGPLILVRADRTGQPTLDIYPLADGTLDTVALLAFAGTDSVYVVTAYAQYGSYDFTEASAAVQPRIVNAGVLDTDGAFFNGGQDLASATMIDSDFTGGSGTTVQIVNDLVVPTGGGGPSFSWRGNYVGEYLNQFGGFYSDVPENFARVVGAQVSVDTRHVVSRERSGADAVLRVDGSVTASRSDASGAISGSSIMYVGRDLVRGYFTGNIASYCVWSDTTDAAGRAAALA